MGHILQSQTLMPVHQWPLKGRIPPKKAKLHAHITSGLKIHSKLTVETYRPPTNQLSTPPPPKKSEAPIHRTGKKKSEFLGFKVPPPPGVPLTGPGATSSLVCQSSHWWDVGRETGKKFCRWRNLRCGKPWETSKFLNARLRLCHWSTKTLGSQGFGRKLLILCRKPLDDCIKIPILELTTLHLVCPFGWKLFGGFVFLCFVGKSQGMKWNPRI